MDSALADRVRQAFSDRDEIFRRMDSLGGALPTSQREEVSRSAMALADKVQSLAMALDETSRMDVTSARAQLEGEISALENAGESRSSAAARIACGGSRISSASGARSSMRTSAGKRSPPSSRRARSRCRTCAST